MCVYSYMCAEHTHTHIYNVSATAMRTYVTPITSPTVLHNIQIPDQSALNIHA